MRKYYATINKDLNIHYLQCENCFAISASHYVKSNVLDKYYEQYYKLRQHISDVLLTMDDYIGFAKHITSHLSLEKENIKILDFGGGCGLISYNIANELLKKGIVKQVDILVVDYEENTVVSSNPNIAISSEKKLSDDCETFDLVIASAILEHIFFVEDTYRKLFQCVANKGYFYIRAPYLMPIYKSCMMAGIKIDSLYPEHVHDFSKRFFEKHLTPLINRILK
jgi:2-polyprenyl-3-methyl-5-hydroxy-6-metoxy-1,4-benzoquinol methylase